MAAKGFQRMPTLVSRPTFHRTKTELLVREVKTAQDVEVKGEGQMTTGGNEVQQHGGGSPPLDGTRGVADDVNSEDEYDTDLEEEERVKSPVDRYGRRIYRLTCRKLKINPIMAVAKCLATSILHIRGRGFHDHDTLAICNALLENVTVTTLSLEDNGIGPKGAEYISLALAETSRVKFLSLADNNIGSQGAPHIIELLQENYLLTTVNLSGNSLQDRDGIAFAKFLRTNSSLVNLNLSHNSLGDVAAQAIGTALGRNRTLKYLNLSWNKIRPPGGVAICKGIKKNGVLLAVYLAYNGLAVPGAKAIADALTVSQSLQDLDLTCNRIFDEGAMEIGKALLSNETLQKLKITNNPTTTASAVALLSVLQKNRWSALELLDMSSSHIYKDALQTVEDITRLRPTFRFLYGGLIHSDGSQAAANAAMNNRNPLFILEEYIAMKNYRMIDLFKQFDKDGSGSVSREEFIAGLQSIEVPMTVKQLDTLIKMLDKDGDGEIDYAELLKGDREYRRHMRLQREAAERARKADRIRQRKARLAEKEEDEKEEQQMAARRMSQVRPPQQQQPNTQQLSTVMQLL